MSIITILDLQQNSLTKFFMQELTMAGLTFSFTAPLFGILLLPIGSVHILEGI